MTFTMCPFNVCLQLLQSRVSRFWNDSTFSTFPKPFKSSQFSKGPSSTSKQLQRSQFQQLCFSLWAEKHQWHEMQHHFITCFLRMIMNINNLPALDMIVDGRGPVGEAWGSSLYIDHKQTFYATHDNLAAKVEHQYLPSFFQSPCVGFCILIA